VGIPVIIADARRTENLIKLGVLQADAVIPCTDNEPTNLDIAFKARKLDLSVVSYLQNGEPHLHPGPGLQPPADVQILALVALETLGRLHKLNLPGNKKSKK
jgi:hypothetical protein